MKAYWSAEQFGPPARRGQLMDLLGGAPGRGRPWVAEIVGFSAEFDFDREFVAGRADYARANARGTRGVWWHWVLESGPLYELYEPRSWTSSRRFFTEVAADTYGAPALVEVAYAEVVARLEELTDTAHVDLLEDE